MSDLFLTFFFPETASLLLNQVTRSANTIVQYHTVISSLPCRYGHHLPLFALCAYQLYSYGKCDNDAGLDPNEFIPLSRIPSSLPTYSSTVLVHTKQATIITLLFTVLYYEIVIAHGHIFRCPASAPNFLTYRTVSYSNLQPNPFPSPPSPSLSPSLLLLVGGGWLRDSGLSVVLIGWLTIEFSIERCCLQFASARQHHVSKGILLSLSCASAVLSL